MRSLQALSEFDPDGDFVSESGEAVHTRTYRGILALPDRVEAPYR